MKKVKVKVRLDYLLKLKKELSDAKEQIAILFESIEKLKKQKKKK